MLQEIQQKVEKLQVDVKRFDQISTLASCEARISALENEIKTNNKKSDEDKGLMGLVESFFTNLSEVQKRIKAYVKEKIGKNMSDMENFVREQMLKEMQERQEDKSNNVNLLRVKNFKKKVEKIKLEGVKLLKEAKKAAKNVQASTAMFSVLIGSFINLQTIRQNPEYYWLLIVLTVTMFFGTLFISFMSFTDLKKYEKKLLALEESQGPVYVAANKFIIELKTLMPDQSTLLYWTFEISNS